MVVRKAVTKIPVKIVFVLLLAAEIDWGHESGNQKPYIEEGVKVMVFNVSFNKT
jgi:hypothetical protein